jgi:hypothetical protein
MISSFGSLVEKRSLREFSSWKSGSGSSPASASSGASSRRMRPFGSASTKAAAPFPPFIGA